MNEPACPGPHLEYRIFPTVGRTGLKGTLPINGLSNNLCHV